MILRHCNSTSHLKAVEDSRKNGKQARLIDLRMGPSRISKRLVTYNLQAMYIQPQGL